MKLEHERALRNASFECLDPEFHVKLIEEGLARCTDSRDAHFSKFQLVFNN